jgi:hypothetical protein
MPFLSSPDGGPTVLTRVGDSVRLVAAADEGNDARGDCRHQQKGNQPVVNYCLND